MEYITAYINQFIILIEQLKNSNTNISNVFFIIGATLGGALALSIGKLVWDSKRNWDKASRTSEISNERYAIMKETVRLTVDSMGGFFTFLVCFLFLIFILTIFRIDIGKILGLFITGLK